MSLRQNKKGFTLLEILIVLVILGVVAGLAFPVLTANINKSKGQEAVMLLGTVKEAALVYYQTQTPNTYVGMTMAKLGITPGAGGQTSQFSYAFSNLAASTFTCTATWTDPSAVAADKITIEQTGAVVKTGVFT